MLSVNNLSCGYYEKDVVMDVSFSLEENERLCIVGPNGCGKTTVMRALCGLLDYRGEIKLFGNELKTMKRKDISKKIAFMPQTMSVYFSYSVFETVALGRYLVSKKKIFSDISQSETDTVMHYIEKVGLSALADKPITELSGGQLQRVFLARVFAQEPDIILLDEPTNYLDFRHQLELINYLKDWACERNKAVIGVMHDINLALSLADKLIIMNNGKIEATGSPKEIVSGERLSEIYDVDVGAYMKSILKIWE